MTRRGARDIACSSSRRFADRLPCSSSSTLCRPSCASVRIISTTARTVRFWSLVSGTFASASRPITTTVARWPGSHGAGRATAIDETRPSGPAAARSSRAIGGGPGSPRYQWGSRQTRVPTTVSRTTAAAIARNRELPGSGTVPHAATATTISALARSHQLPRIQCWRGDAELSRPPARPAGEPTGVQTRIRQTATAGRQSRIGTSCSRWTITVSATASATIRTVTAGRTIAVAWRAATSNEIRLREVRSMMPIGPLTVCLFARARRFQSDHPRPRRRRPARLAERWLASVAFRVATTEDRIAPTRRSLTVSPVRSRPARGSRARSPSRPC